MKKTMIVYSKICLECHDSGWLMCRNWLIYDKEYHIVMIMMKDISGEEIARSRKEEQSKAAIEITDKVVEKQMRIVQEIASLLGETTAETKIALTKLKETLSDE